MCEHDGVEAYVETRRQFSVSSFHKVEEPKAVSTLTANALPNVPYAISPLPNPVLSAFDFETGSEFFRLVLNLLCS